MSGRLRSLVAATATTLILAMGVLTTAPSAGAAPADAPATTTTAPKTTTTAVTGAPTTPSENPAIDDLVGCVQGSKRLLVLFLIDESASLKQTDPENRRVDAARSALDSLVALASSGGTSAPEVQVALAAFSNDYRLVRDWTPATTATNGKLDRSLSSFAKLNNGIDTDFVNALSSGREALADQAAKVTEGGGAAPCKAVLLFTDGGFDIAVRPTKAAQEKLGLTKPYAPNLPLTNQENVTKAEAAGRAALCRDGGLADRLRNDDITLLTVALSGSVARRAQLPLAAASAGVADGYTCGTQTTRPEGAYLPASDIDVLVAHFNEVGTRLAGGNLLPGTSQVVVCGGNKPCERGVRTFTLDNTLRRAQILALPAKAGAIVRLEGPTGATANISKPGTVKVGDVEVTASAVAGRGFTLDLVRPANLGSWSGTWKVSLQDPDDKLTGTRGTLQIFVFSDIGVTLTSMRPLTRGATSTLTATLTEPGAVKAESVVASTSAEVLLRNPVTGALDTVKLSGPPTGPFSGTYTTPASTTSNVIEATVQARITTTSGSGLLSQSGTVDLLVERPAGSIQFVPPSLKMPSLTGKGSTQTELTITGGDTPGCVWFGTTKVPDLPSGAGGIVVTVDGKAPPTQQSCLKVGARQRVAVTVAASPQDRASGTVRGTLTVFEKTEGAQKATVTQVPFRFDLARGLNQARRLLLALALLVAGLAVPMLALLVINSLTARFQALDAVRGAALPVRISGRSISRLDGPPQRLFSVRTTDFGSLSTAGNSRQFTFGGVVFRARASRNPFGGAMAMAAPEGGAEKLKDNVGSRVELDLGLAGSWVFLLDSDQTRLAPRGNAYGKLIAFVAQGDAENQILRMLDDISDRLPTTAERLANLVRGTRHRPSKRRRKDRADADEQDGGDVAPADDLPPSPAGDGE